ncbi:MAG: ATP-binding protein [Candidatus Aegiribacteria sp.]|nr:ATP-binding protein [Candidatus Aegiribacteria sp.]
MIPFKVDIFVTGRDFCGREADIRKLTEYIEPSFRILIAGERRTGKSSLIMETSRRMPVSPAQLLCSMNFRISWSYRVTNSSLPV